MSKSTLIRIILAIVCAFSLGFFVADIIQSAKGDAEPLNTSFLTNISVNQNIDTIQARDIPLTNDEQINIEVYSTRNKSVVNITTEVLAYNWFFEAVPQEGGIGSGSIIDEKKGYILTNNHVVENANKLFVTLWDETKLEAKIIGIDKENDLSIIQINTKGLVLTSIPIGDSRNLKIGQKVLAIGNPFGLDRTLTTGIISGLGRPIRSSRNIVIKDMIQTDASINPGNSGGPLLNSKGEIIGINTIILSPSSGSIGLGFAVPSTTVARVIPELITHGKVRRGWIEWDMRPLFPEIVQYAKLTIDKGLLITKVGRRGNAAKAGIRGGSKSQAVQYGRQTILLGGDIIVKVNEWTVSSLSDYLDALESTRSGDTITIEYYRNDKYKTTKIKLVDRPDNLIID